MDSLKEYSLVEVSSHNTKDDLWIAIDGKVYNVTGYLNEHPGGEEILQGVAGKDATAAFEDAAHSDDAFETMEKLLVGKLPPHEQPRRPAQTQSLRLVPQPQPAGKRRSEMIAKLPVCCAAGVGIYLAKTMLPLSMRSLVPKIAQKLSERPNSPSLMDFWGGALTTASLNVLCLCFMASRFFEKHKPIESYPAYIRPARPLPCPGANGKRKQVLDPGRYQSFTLIEKQQVARSVYRFILRLPEEGVPLGLPLGQHIRVVARIDGQRVQRSYTPTSALDCGSTLELTVKVYPQGKMSNYLLNLPLNSEVSVSGPFGSFRDYHPGKWEQIGCIAGGSGITPIYQLVRAICENPIDSTKVYLLYGNETHEDILLRGELDELSRRYPTKLLAHHILAHPPPGWEGQSGWINIQMMQKLLPQPGDKTGYLICGPQGMVKAMKQNLEVMGGRDMVSDTSRVFVF